MIKFILESLLAHQACRLFKTFFKVKAERFEWSVRTERGLERDQVYRRYLDRASTIANISLSPILQFFLALESFLDLQAIGYRRRFLLQGTHQKRIAKIASFKASVLRIKLRVGLKWRRIGFEVNRDFNLLKASCWVEF